MAAIVIFDREGRPLATWGEEVFAVPHDIWIDAEDRVYIAKGGGVSLFTIEGRLITQWVVTGGPNNRPHGAHGTWADRHGDIHVGEIGSAICCKNTGGVEPVTVPWQ